MLALTSDGKPANLLMKADGFDVVENVEQVRLDGVRVGRLTQDLQESRIRHEEKAWEQQTFLLQIPSSEEMTICLAEL